MKRAGFLFSLFLCGFVLPVFPAESPTRAVIVTEEGCLREEAELYTLLGKEEGWDLVERAQLDLLLKEKALKTAMGNSPALGRLLGADVFFHLRKAGLSVRLEMVDAESGRLLSGQGWAEFKKDSKKLLQGADGRKMAKGLRVVVWEKAGPRTPEAAAAVREFLGSSGRVVLDRLASRHVAVEHGLSANGINNTDPSQIAPMLGADILVSVLTQEETFGLTVLDVGSGKSLASSQYAWKAGRELPEEALKWLGQNVRLTAKESSNYFPEIQMEALEPLYRGIGEYRKGDYENALVSFQEAYELNDKFPDALLWEGLCYEAMGLPEMGKALRRFVESGLVGRGASLPLEGEKAQGLSFLGVSGPDTGAASVASALVVDVLLKKSKERVLLPEHLAVWREEYDALVGVDKTEGGGWAKAPRFFVTKSLHGSMDKDGGIRLSLMDNSRGTVLGIVQTKKLEGKEGMKELEAALGSLLSGKQASEKIPAPEWKVSASIGELEKQVGSQDTKKANLALVSLIKIDPGNRVLWGSKIKRDGDYGSEFGGPGLEGILNFGYRDELIARLPERDNHRAWLELSRLSLFLPWNEQGVIYTGTNPDIQILLEAFVKKHAGEATGAMAGYMLQFEKLQDLPFGEIAANWEKVAADMRSSPGFSKVSNSQELIGFAQHLRDLGKIASGDIKGRDYLPKDYFPYRIQPEIQGYERVRFIITSRWIGNEWSFCRIPPEYWQQEAAAALKVIYGRRNNSVKVDARKIPEYSESLVFLCFTIKSLHEVDHEYGRRPLYPFRMDMEYENYRELVQFCRMAIPRQLKRLQDINKSETIFDMPRQLVTFLQRFNFASQVSDHEFEQIRTEMISALDEAAQRSGKPAEDGYGNYWRTMPRYFDPLQHPFWRYPPPENVRDPARFLQNEQKLAASSFQESPVIRREWHDWIRSNEFGEWVPREKRAELVAAQQGRLEQLYGKGLLSVAEMGFLFDCANLLFEGGRLDLAEPWFERVAKAPSSVFTAVPLAEELRTNAKLYQAYCLRRMKREAEALVLVKEVMESSNGESYGMMSYFKRPADIKYHFGDEGKKLRAYALRLLRELRMQELAKSDPQIRLVEIDAPLSREKTVRYYFRLPKGYPQKNKPSRILLFSPSWSHSGPEYCLGENTWTRFCDQNNLVLCAPDFDGLMENSDSPYQTSQQWSGASTLSAIDAASKWGGVDTGKLLVYGYGGGGRFAGNFARFAPERCLAVVSFGVSDFGMQDHLPRMESVGRMKDLPIAVSLAEGDGMPNHEMGRYTWALNQAAQAEVHGLKVLWRGWPGFGHTPTPQTDRLAQVYLVQALRPEAFKDWKNPIFVGDRRSGEFFRSGDPGIKLIPAEWRQPLVSRELAEAWRGR